MCMPRDIQSLSAQHFFAQSSCKWLHFSHQKFMRYGVTFYIVFVILIKILKVYWICSVWLQSNPFQVYLFVISWTADLSLEKVQISDRLCNMLTAVSMLLNMSSNNLYLYGSASEGGAGVAKWWNLSYAGAFGSLQNLLWNIMQAIFFNKKNLTYHW